MKDDDAHKYIHHITNVHVPGHRAPRYSPRRIYILFALLCFAFIAFPSEAHTLHSLVHATTDKLSRHAYTLPCLMGGGSYDAVFKVVCFASTVIMMIFLSSTTSRTNPLVVCSQVVVVDTLMAG